MCSATCSTLFEAAVADRVHDLAARHGLAGADVHVGIASASDGRRALGGASAKPSSSSHGISSPLLEQLAQRAGVAQVAEQDRAGQATVVADESRR